MTCKFLGLGFDSPRLLCYRQGIRREDYNIFYRTIFRSLIIKNKFMENEEQILEILKENREILKQTYESAEKTRKYFLYTAIATILMFVLPIIGLIIVIPMFLNSYLKGLDGLMM